MDTATKDDQDTSLQYQFLAEMTLDFIDSKLANAAPNTIALLLIHNGVSVYGSLSNTKIKYLVGMDASCEALAVVHPVITRLRGAYTEYLCNPFWESDSFEVRSERFNRQIEGVFS